MAVYSTALRPWVTHRVSIISIKQQRKINALLSARPRQRSSRVRGSHCKPEVILNNRKWTRRCNLRVKVSRRKAQAGSTRNLDPKKRGSVPQGPAPKEI